jgi:hypothetical protein
MSDRDWTAYSRSTYAWKPGHPKHLRVTKSSLTSDFDFCPKQYEYKRVHGLPTPETDAMRKGTNVHNAVEYYFNNVYPYLDDLLTLMQRDKRDEALALALSILPEETYELGEEKSIETRLKWDLERLLAGGKDDYLPIINEAEVHAFTEEEFEFNGEVLTIPIHWAGSIDRAFATENGVALMELKTGKWLQTAKTDTTGTVTWEDQSFKVDSMRIEMAFYKHLLKVADHEHQNVTHWGWVYPSGEVEGLDAYNKYGLEQRSVNRIFYEPINANKEGQKQSVSRYAEGRVQRLKEALITAYLTDDFPPKPSQGKCAWCDFKSICPSWEGSDDPKEYIAKMQEEE